MLEREQEVLCGGCGRERTDACGGLPGWGATGAPRGHKQAVVKREWRLYGQKTGYLGTSAGMRGVRAVEGPGVGVGGSWGQQRRKGRPDHCSASRGERESKAELRPPQGRLRDAHPHPDADVGLEGSQG